MGDSSHGRSRPDFRPFLAKVRSTRAWHCVRHAEHVTETHARTSEIRSKKPDKTDFSVLFRPKKPDSPNCATRTPTRHAWSRNSGPPSRPTAAGLLWEQEPLCSPVILHVPGCSGLGDSSRIHTTEHSWTWLQWLTACNRPRSEVPSVHSTSSPAWHGGPPPLAIYNIISELKCA